MRELETVSNDAENVILKDAPYFATVTIEGTSSILFHRWSVEGVEAKSKAKKGSVAKKTDDIETYVYRDSKGNLAIPGTYIVGSITNPKNGAAKYLQDPRSPRKSALDLYKAGLVCTTELASLGTKEWDYVDQRRVVVQKSGLTRKRPAMNPGWRAVFEFAVITPEYIQPADLLAVLNMAGRLVGIADMRPTYGRYSVVNFSHTQELRVN